MFQFQSEKVTDHVRRIHGYSDEQMYLIEGRDRAVLVEEERLLIIGDACNPFTFLFFPEALGLSEYEENLKAYRKRVEGLYDRAVFCHGAVEEPAADIIENVIEACEIVKRGEAADIPVMFTDGTRGLMAKAVNEQFADADGKYGNVVYNPDKL